MYILKIEYFNFITKQLYQDLFPRSVSHISLYLFSEIITVIVVDLFLDLHEFIQAKPVNPVMHSKRFYSLSQY
jgi:hypothetical protein